MNLQEKYKNIFEAALLIEIEKNSTLISANEGDIILDVGKTIRVMPIVLSGIIKVSRLDENGHELLLYYINPNEGCAMTFTCCMQQQKSEIKAIVEESAQILAIPIAFMDEWMMKYPTWKSFVMKTIKTRFAELLKTIDQIAFQKLDERLINYLKEKSKATHSSLINLSHEQIANELATSRVVISRLLKKLENDNKLLLYRNQIKLLKEL
ncbi:MAG: Crp/Fnr family transcriptional regulator [Chitinophagaceae bacterium]|nr:Crp/Fnr family transcriptional regulator [Chitinophagaceae bacterium]